MKNMFPNPVKFFSKFRELMPRGNNVVLLLFLSILVHLALFYVKGFYPPTKTIDGWQQEHFLDYVASLKTGNFPQDLNFIDTRFFPGFPVTILSLSYLTGSEFSAGVLLSLFLLILIYALVYHLTKSQFYAFFITIFPPIVFEQTAKISTESLLIAIFFLIYLLYIRKKHTWALALAGFATVVRPVAFFIALPILFRLITEKKFKTFFIGVLLYIIFPTLLAIFNLYFLGDIFYQIRANSGIGEASFSFLQIFFDIYINILKGDLRMIVSGLIYLVFSIYLLVKVLGARSDFLYSKDGLFIKIWTVGTFLFIFSIGPLEFLSVMRRFLSVFYPLALTVNYKHYINKKLFLIFGTLLMVVAFA